MSREGVRPELLLAAETQHKLFGVLCQFRVVSTRKRPASSIGLSMAETLPLTRSAFISKRRLHFDFVVPSTRLPPYILPTGIHLLPQIEAS